MRCGCTRPRTCLWTIKVISVTRRYSFSASHRLHVPDWPEAENDAVFGKCNHPFGHGHNYEIYVTARGLVDQGSGLAIDLQKLDRLIAERVLSVFHLKNMNADVAAFAKTVPTTEIRKGWAETFPDGPEFEKVRIYETDRNIFEVSNEKD